MGVTQYIQIHIHIHIQIQSPSGMLGLSGSDYDIWETAMGLTPPSRLNDDDGDGYTNEHEYFFGLDPNSNLNINQPTASSQSDSGKLYPAITYTRRTDPSVNYVVVACDDLVSWIPATSMVQLTVDDNLDGTETITLRYNIEYDLLPNKRMFFRVKATD